MPVEVTHRAMVGMAVPTMLAYLSTSLVGLTDTAVLGRLGDPALVGGISAAVVLFNLLFATLNFLRSATTGLTAQAAGAGRATEASAILCRALLLALLAGLAAMVLRAPFAGIGFAALGLDGETLDAARAYFGLRILSAPFALGNYAVLGWVFGRGEAGRGLALQVLLNGLNAAACVVCVLGWGWGVRGAALATVLAEGVTFLAGLGLAAPALLGRARPGLARVFDGRALRRMGAVNRDIMIRSFALIFVFAWFTRQGAAFGPAVLAANAVHMQFFMLASNGLDGFATAAEQLAGRAVGARDRRGLARTARLSIGWGIALAAPLTLLYAVAGPGFIALLTASGEVRAAALASLPWAALMPAAAVLAFQLDGVFIGATWSRDMRDTMLLAVLAYLLAWAALAPWLGNAGLWTAFLVFLAARGLGLAWRLRRRMAGDGTELPPGHESPAASVP